jgi:hypothetical protein
MLTLLTLENAKKTKQGEFNELEGILGKCIKGKKFEVVRDSEREGKYVGKEVIINRKYNYSYEKNVEGEEIYIGDVVWTSIEGIKENDISFYLRELKPLEEIKNPEFLD